MKRRTFSTARFAALASLLCMQGPLAMQSQAGPAPTAGSFTAFIEKFWQEAWGSEFQLQQSGLLIDERAPGVFRALATDGQRAVAEGTWVEIQRLELPGLGSLGGTSDQFSIDQAVSAGIIVGAKGFISPAYGLNVTVTWQAAEGIRTTQTFAPLGLADDADGAVQGANALYAQLGAVSPVNAEYDDYTLDWCRCREKYDNERAACAWRCGACQATCLGAAIVAIAGCSLLGPLAPACMSAAIYAYTACLAACLATEVACLRDAANRFIDCQEKCFVPFVDSPWRR